MTSRPLAGTAVRRGTTAGRAGAPAEPLWRQLAQTLRADIARGVYRIGMPLPTEEELGKRFSVSRQTVREALRQLRSDGLVASRRGSGTTVTAPPPSTSFNVHRVASIDELITYAAEIHFVAEQTDVVGSADLSGDEIPLPPGRQWLRIRGHRFTNDPAAPPVCWTEVYVASEYAGIERLTKQLKGPIWHLVEAMYGERLVEVEQTIRVRSAGRSVASGLGIEEGASVVEVRRSYRTTMDKIAEVSVSLYPAEKFQFSMKLRRA